MMATAKEEDLKAVLRTLKLAQAQLRPLKNECTDDLAAQGEIDDAEIAIELLVNKLKSILP